MLKRSRHVAGRGAAITRTIVDGVPKPKQYMGVMPPMGGAPLTPAQVSVLAAYVWALGHEDGR